MLWDMLGTLVGFAGIMLVLSFLVTTLVQATQHVFHLRGKNLRYGIERLLETVKESEGDYDSRALAGKITSGADMLKERNWFKKILRGAAVTWITAEELGSEVSRYSAEIGSERVTRISKLFEGLESELKQRFSVFMRYISIVWALVVAIVFQVSTPQILGDLSKDPELRVKHLGEARVTLDRVATSLQERRAEVSEEALRQVAELKTALNDVRGALKPLPRLDLRPWPNGFAFYRNLGNLLGVLISTAFLTLGAPFWFNALRNLVNLRDALAPPGR